MRPRIQHPSKAALLSELAPVGLGAVRSSENACDRMAVVEFSTGLGSS